MACAGSRVLAVSTPSAVSRRFTESRYALGSTCASIAVGMMRWTPSAQRTHAAGEVHWLGDAPFVPMIETSHLGKLHDLSCVWPVNSTGNGSILAQRQVGSGP
jgi:hypothetical protein